MKSKLLKKLLSITAALATAITLIGTESVYASDESVNYEELFSSAGSIKQIDLGCAFSAAITTNGNLYTWGFNSRGELGDGTTNERHLPVKIMSNVTYVSLGGNHGAAITDNGDLYTWGGKLQWSVGRRHYNRQIYTC